MSLIVTDRKSGSAGMPRPISYAVFCLKKKIFYIYSLFFTFFVIFFFFMIPLPPLSTLFPYTTLFRSLVVLLPFQLLRLSLATPSRWTPLALSVFLHCVVALLLTLL